MYKITSKKTSDEDGASPSGHESNDTELTSVAHEKERTLLTYVGDAAFLFHFIHKSNYSFLITVISHLLEKEEQEGEETEEQKNDSTSLTCLCCK